MELLHVNTTRRCLVGHMARHTCQIGPTDTAPLARDRHYGPASGQRGECFGAGNLSAPISPLQPCYYSASIGQPAAGQTMFLWILTMAEEIFVQFLPHPTLPFQKENAAYLCEQPVSQNYTRCGRSLKMLRHIVKITSSRMTKLSD